MFLTEPGGTKLYPRGQADRLGSAPCTLTSGSGFYQKNCRSGIRAAQSLAGTGLGSPHKHTHQRVHAFSRDAAEKR